MKVSIAWVKQFIEFELPPIDELVARIGAQLGEVEGVVDYGAKYKGVVVAKISSVTKHPDADRLNICLIDDGGVTQDIARNQQGLVQVVCGAPNVRDGMLVAWLPPGSTVPNTYDKDPFKLEARELRGQMSNGMLASARELAIGEGHEGILEIDVPVSPGTAFADAYQLNDYIIDIENKMFTHRPDGFGQLGVAREIAGILGQAFTSPDWYGKLSGILDIDKTTLPVKVVNEVPELVPRLSVVTLQGISVKPSPVIIQTFLQRVGIRPINNVVDVTNYIMMLTGQPLHAYDYDKVKALDGNDYATLTARKPRTDEEIALLNGKKIKPRADAIVIASESTAMGLGGVMGGSDTEVGQDTKNVVLECATFDMYSIRRTSMAHGLFSEAVTRFNKGQSPSQNIWILQETVNLLQAVAGAELASPVEDNVGEIGAEKVVTVSADFINRRLGSTMDAHRISQLLTNVEFIVDVTEQYLTITAPFWRTDIAVAEDIVEEIGRLYGFDNLPTALPSRKMVPVVGNSLWETKSTIRRIMSAQGANEVLSYSFVHGKLIDAVGQKRDRAFELNNALSPDLQYYRMTIVPGLLEKVHANIRAGYDEFVLYEMGRTHMVNHKTDESGLPEELQMFAAVYAQNDKEQSGGAAYYELKHQLESLAERLGFKLDYQPILDDPGHTVTAPFDIQRSSLVSVADSDIFLGIIGEFKPSVRTKLKLPAHSAGFEIAIDAVMLAFNNGKQYTSLSKYPSVEQDICLRVTEDTAYQAVFDVVWEALKQTRPSDSTWTLSPLDIYHKDDYKQITLRYRVVSKERTLTTAEVASSLSNVADIASAKLGAIRV